MLFKTLDKNAFAQTLLFHAEKAGLGPLFYDPNAFVLRGAEPSGTISLQNFFSEYQAAAFWKRNAVLSGFAEHFRETASLLVAGTPAVSQDGSLPDFKDAPLSLLRPRIRPRFSMEVLHMQAAIEGVPKPNIPFSILGGGELTLEVVLDLPQSIVSVSSDQLESWGMTFEAALATAGNNLVELGADRFTSPQTGLFVSGWNDLYDASRLYLTQFARELNVKGRHVAMIPNRDTFLVTGEDDAEGLTAMARLAAQAIQPRPLSGYAFRLETGTDGNADWIPFLPASNHPAYRLLRESMLHSAGPDYAGQRELLKLLYEKQGSDIYVADLMVLKGADGGLFSVTTWTDGVTALLPRAGKIGFIGFSPRGETIIFGEAEWDRALEVMGEAVMVQAIYPTRYLVESFPTPEQLRQMGIN